METISISRLTQQLLALGVPPGNTLLVHCAFSKVHPVEDGPLGLISALQAALGPDGTLVMPSMTDDDDHPFDLAKTPCRGMGIAADTFWRMPGVLRSDSPHAFAARGPMASRITASHPADIPHGLDSPVGRVYDLDGWVLLLGVGHTEDTTIHLAEFLAGVRYRRKKSLIRLVNGCPARLDYAEIDHCCENFAKMDTWLDARKLQTRESIGYAAARLIRSQDIVAVTTERLRENETVFLHPLGVDSQCDEARSFLESHG
ncbi:MAG TPA: AAC(3) family N-acetyltransferase [Anaerolineales bacterium]